MKLFEGGSRIGVFGPDEQVTFISLFLQILSQFILMQITRSFALERMRRVDVSNWEVQS